jgi:hypothetical protein
MKATQTVLGLLLLVAGTSTVAMAAAVTPEIAVGTAGSGVALVSGIVLLFRARRSQK